MGPSYIRPSLQTEGYLLTPWNRGLSEKLSGLRLLKKFSAFYGTPRFIAAFTTTHHLSLSWARSSQAMTPTHPTCLRSILILSFHLFLRLPSGLLPSGFPTKTLCATSRLVYSATYPAHLSILGFITRMIFARDPESYITGSVATGRASLAGQVTG